MEKLKKYNQKLLAIIGTLAVLLLSGLTIFAIVALIMELTKPDYVHVDDSFTIETPIEDSIKYRDQTVTFRKPILTDTTNSKYLIPVSQIRLGVPEAYEDAQFNLISGSGYRKKRYYASSRRSGNFNNFILNFTKTGKEEIIFKQRSFITSYQFFEVDSNVYIIFEASINDLNKDKKLNARDLKSFFCFNVSQNKLTEVSLADKGLLDSFIDYNSNTFTLEFGVDKNKNGSIDYSEEPSILKSFNYLIGELTDLISEKSINEVQRIID